MITVTFNRISLAIGSVISPTPFTIYYKLISDADYTLVEGGVYVDEYGYILSSPLPSISVNESGTYIFKAVNDFCGAEYFQQFYINDNNLYEWVGNDGYCEQSTPLNLFDAITGFADPRDSGYDSVTGRVYIVDASAITSGSNIYWFDPDSISSASDVTPVGSLNVFAIASIMDMENRKIYISGSDTGGLIRYDIATDTVSTLAYGTNDTYTRLYLLRITDSIYASIDMTEQKVYFLDIDSFVVSDSVLFSAIPDANKYMSDGTYILFINGEYWVIQSQGSSGPSYADTIGRYNSDFDTLIGTISLPDQAQWDNNSYWRTIFLDGTNLFIFDMGSCQLIKVDTITLLVEVVHEFTNREGKTNASLSMIRDEVTFELFISGDYRNTTLDSTAIPVTYKLSDTTFEPTVIYPGVAYGSIMRRVGVSDMLVSAYVGSRLVYPTNPPGAATDGIVSIFTKSGTGNNTGKFIWLTLQEVNTYTGVPTGNTGVNSSENPHYIAPFDDLSTCPVTYTALCPDVPATFSGSNAEYEYSLEPSTYNNPAIDHIILEQVDTVSSIVVATTNVPKNLYQSGTLTKVGSNPNQVNLLFKDAGNNTLSTCTNVFTIP